jgi:hypothetical protein
MFYEQQITLDSVGELMKYLWPIIDNPKIEVKERMKAMNLMLQCHYMRARLIGSGVFVKEFSDYAEKVESDEETLRIREEEISRREKLLERELELSLPFLNRLIRFLNKKNLILRNTIASLAC